MNSDKEQAPRTRFGLLGAFVPGKQRNALSCIAWVTYFLTYYRRYANSDLRYDKGDRLYNPQSGMLLALSSKGHRTLSKKEAWLVATPPSYED